MAETKHCARCEAEIPPGARWGLCHRCLIDLAAEPLAEPSGDSSQSFGEPGRRFGDYQLGRQIGRGGMGVVYEAVQVSLRRTVALKMILDSQATLPLARRRFTIEAEAAARLDHPNIVPIYEVGEQDQQPFLSMKLVQGESLRKKIARGELCVTGTDGDQTNAAIRKRESAVAQLMARVARAVHHAHQHGVLHRDLKPGNILVDREGQPYLTDFGLAKILDHAPGEDTQAPLTLAGTILGTPNYMSPEQTSGARLTAASDIYSLGAILYELLTGQPPFKAATPLETMRLVTEQEARRPSTWRRRLDRDLETICLKCLEKNPDARYHSAEALAEDFERWLRREPIKARPAGPILRLRRWTKRNPVGAALILSLFGGLTVALVLLQLALERQKRLGLHRAGIIDMYSQQVQALWDDASKTCVHINSWQLAALTERSPRQIGPETVKLTFAVRISGDPLGQAIVYAPFLRLLEEKMEKILHRPVVFDLRVYKPIGAAIQQTLAQGENDFMCLGFLAYLRAKQTAPDLQPVVWELTTKDAVIFARSASGITNLSQVTGHRVAFAHTNSPISFWAKVHLARAGVSAADLKTHQNLESSAKPGAGTTKKEVASEAPEDADVEVHSHKIVIQKVLANEFDVGEAQRRHFEMSKYKGLVELHSYPVTPDLYVARAGLAPAVKEAFRQSLVALKKKHEKRLLAPLQATPIQGFKPVTDQDFDDLRSALTNELARFESGPPSSLPPPATSRAPKD